VRFGSCESEEARAKKRHKTRGKHDRLWKRHFLSLVVGSRLVL
jgi:hypothetical protein